MDTRELNPPSTSRALAAAAGLVAGLTAVGVLIGAVAPGLAGRVGPHPVLTGSIADAGSILLNNLRVLAAPFLLALLGIARSRTGRLLGDLLLLMVTAASTLTVGVALGRWQGRLIPYIPQLPVEWAALAVALSAWLLTRNHTAGPKRLLGLAVTTVALITVAAAVETWCTPQRSQGQTATGPTVDRPGDLASQVMAGGCFRDGLCAASGYPLQGHFVLFPSQVRFRSAGLGGADRAHNNHRPTTGGINPMNSVNLTGRLTTDPELKTTKTDTQVTSLRLAVQRPRRGGEDQGADYVDVTVFGQQAEIASQYLSKGRKIGVVGRLHHSEWDSDTGRRQKLEVIADQIEFLDPRQTTDTEEAQPAATAA